MNILSGSLSISLDLASHFWLRGCAFDTADFGFPKGLSILTQSGQQRRLLPENAICDPLMQQKAGLPTEPRLSFDLHLFDMLNESPGNISILDANDTPIWSLEEDLRAFHPMPGQTPSYPAESGGRQLVILIGKNSRIVPMMDTILQWQPKAMKKKFLSSMSVAVISLTNLAKHKASLLAHKNTTFLLDEACFNEALQTSPALMHSAPIIILSRDKGLRTENWSGGLPQVLSEIARLPENSPLDVVSFYRMITHLGGYVELFFPTGANHFVYHSGQTDETIQDYVREELQERSEAQAVLISRQPLHHLRQLDEVPHTLMVNLHAMRHVMDVFNQSGYDFVKTALSRGVKIENVILETLA